MLKANWRSGMFSWSRTRYNEVAKSYENVKGRSNYGTTFWDADNATLVTSLRFCVRFLPLNFLTCSRRKSSQSISVKRSFSQQSMKIKISDWYNHKVIRYRSMDRLYQIIDGTSDSRWIYLFPEIHHNYTDSVRRPQNISARFCPFPMWTIWPTLKILSSEIKGVLIRVFLCHSNFKNRITK